jgi:hypothetical protein
LTLLPGKVAFRSPTLLQIVQDVSPVLSAVRILQNLLLPLAAHAFALRHGVAQSIAHAMPKIEAYGFPEAMVHLVRQYWDCSGAILREYRNIDQHYGQMIRHAFVSVPDGKLVIPVPDDPSVRSARKFSFDKERDAVDVCAAALVEINGVFDNTLQIAGYPASPLRDSIEVGAAGSVLPGLRRTFGLHVLNVEENQAFEFGHTADSHVYVHTFRRRGTDGLAPTPDDNGGRAAIAERAYFLWLHRSGRAWWDADANWLEAELFERDAKRI